MKVDHAPATAPIHKTDYDKDHVLDLSVDFYSSGGNISVTGNQTLGPTFNGLIVRSDDVINYAYTLPNNNPVGFNVTVIQRNVGQIQFVPAAGATLVNINGYTKTGGRYSIVTLIVDDNPDGQSAEYILSGNGQ